VDSVLEAIAKIRTSLGGPGVRSPARGDETEEEAGRDRDEDRECEDARVEGGGLEAGGGDWRR
jgi:hypothetical protein